MFKSPFGATEENRYIRLRLRLPKDCGVWFVFCRIFSDGKPATDTEMTFEWCDGDSLYYKCDVKLCAGLYFYSFYYKTEHDVFFVNKSRDNKSVLGDGGAWQLTVYEKDFETPASFAGGVIYQIFPDRFYSANPEKPYIKGRTLRTDWGGQPAYSQKENEVNLGTDFFGGDFRGISQKMPYIKSLGTTAIYLNPVFYAASNHRYNTSDYKKIDPYLGTEKDFCEMCDTAHSYGIKIILDGVFSHTGDDSVYFDKYGKNTEISGAYQSRNSPYYDWYKFKKWPNDYHSWWGISTLPEVVEENESYLEFICGENGVLRHWLRLGADGWRLDVADELPDVFLDRLRAAVKAEKPDALIIGEVWEDATNKISYSVRRRYFLGRQLDSVMNYPFCNAIIEYVKGGTARKIAEVVETVCENYPQKCLNLLMNHIGTHDTARILSVLGYRGEYGNRENQAHLCLSQSMREKALVLLRMAAILQYTFPGIPSLYYGDEAAVEGFCDPFCRACYPWGKENEELLSFYRKLGKLREDVKVLKQGVYKTVVADGGLYAFTRSDRNGTLLVALNNENGFRDMYFRGLENYKPIFGEGANGDKINLSENSFALFYKSNE